MSAPAFLSVGEIAKIGGARKHPDARIELPGDANHLSAASHSRRRENQAARTGGAGAFERLALRRISVDRGDALLPQLADGIHVELDDRRLDAVLTKQPRHGAPGRTVADDDRAEARIGWRLFPGRRRPRRRRP